MEVLGEPSLLLIYFVYTPAGDFHLCFAPRVCRLRVQGISLLHHVILKHQTLLFSPASWCLFCPILSVQSCWSCHQGDLLQEQRCAHAGQVCLLSLGGWALGGGQLGVPSPTANYHRWKIRNTRSGIFVYAHSWYLDGSFVRTAIDVPAWKCHRS